ncbi:MAG: CotH kinase family protein, partial [Crocinitomicaceae bacterium]|nr:CotH kinase family protein [Crocinitomicaceae bacterium]
MALGFNSCSERKDHSLPVVEIDYYADHLGLGDYSDCEIKLYDEDGKIIFDLEPRIKYRGNSSFQYSKKSFTLKLNKSKSFAGMEKSVYWKLNADYIDKTFMRNKLSYDLFRSLTPGNFAPEVNFIVLYENEKYRGIYSIVEGVDEFRLGLDLDDFQAVLFKEPPLHYPPSEHKQRYKDFAHYSEISNRYARYSQKAKKKLINRAYYNQRYPYLSDSNKKKDIHKLTAFIHNSSDEEFKEKVFKDYFDFNNIIDWHLILLITNNGDGIKKNNYIYKKGAGQPYLYCPWDFDHSFGREGDGEPMKESICDIESH